MNQAHDKSTIIDGAGGGIGSDVALEFARQGARLGTPLAEMSTEDLMAPVVTGVIAGP
jgi:NAD(P)-dependent dehydrogenase (short-subunit alcohol dehydrogenase family)